AAAADPKSAFGSGIASRLAAVEELRHARDTISPMLTQMQVHVGAPAKSTYKVVQGRAEIYALRDRLVDGARKSVDWATTFGPSVQLADLSGGLETLRLRVTEGVQLRAILKTNASGWRKLAAFRAFPSA